MSKLRRAEKVHQEAAREDSTNRNAGLSALESKLSRIETNMLTKSDFLSSIKDIINTMNELKTLLTSKKNSTSYNAIFRQAILRIFEEYKFLDDVPETYTKVINESKNNSTKKFPKILKENEIDDLGEDDDIKKQISKIFNNVRSKAVGSIHMCIKAEGKEKRGKTMMTGIVKNSKLSFSLFICIPASSFLCISAPSSSPPSSLFHLLLFFFFFCSLCTSPDGKALCALTNSLEPGVLDLSQLPHRSPLDNARTGTEAAEKDLGIPPILQPEDLVSPDVDELSVMTYISYFRDYEQEKLKMMEAESLARIPDPLKCIAFGPGLEKAEVGYETDFTVQLRTAGGKDIKVGGETTVDVQIKTPLNSPPIKAEVTDNGDGTYHVRYTPKSQGKTVINVNVRSKPIQNSPFSVNVDKLGVDAAKSQAYGPGLQGGATKEPTHFTIVANNKKGDPVGNGGDRFDVKITDPYGSEVKNEVVDNKDGTYTVNYKPSDVGNHTITVQHEGKNVADSPYHVKVDTSSSGPDPSKSEAYGPGLNGAIGGEPAHFTIQARNKAGENLRHGGDAFDVEVLGPDETPVEVRVVDNKDGTYGVTYQPDEPGKYKVDVILRGANPLFYDHVSNSPVIVNAEVGIDPSKSLVFGPGVEDGVLNTKPAEFFIQPKDKDGKNIDRQNDPNIFDIKVTDQNGNQIDSPIVDNGDGTYKVVYEPTGVGRHKVDVRLKGKPVGNTPVSVNVKDGAWYENTHVDSFSFVIRTKTKKNQDKKEGGETFEVKIVHEGNKEEVKNVKIQDIGDGTYVVSYNLPSEGDYKVNVLLNGKHIKGSPWKQSH